MALSDAQEYDPFAPSTTWWPARTRDPYPDLVAKRRDTPVQKGLTISPDVAARGHRGRTGLDRLPLRRLLADFARRQDVHLDRL